MKRSENITNLLQALCKFQKVRVHPSKDKEATITSQKTGRSFTYKYADLADCLRLNEGLLADLGVWVDQNSAPERENEVGTITTLFHAETGEWKEYEPVYVPAKCYTPQEKNSAITYSRRYSLCIAIGIAPEEDTDAQDIQQNMQEDKKQPKKQYEKKQQNKPSQNQQQQQNDPHKQRKTFFAICGEKKISEKKQKAIVYSFTGKESRKDVTQEEYAVINDFLNKASEVEIARVISQAAQEKEKEKEKAEAEKLSEAETEKLVDSCEEGMGLGGGEDGTQSAVTS